MDFLRGCGGSGRRGWRGRGSRRGRIHHRGHGEHRGRAKRREHLNWLPWSLHCAARRAGKRRERKGRAAPVGMTVFTWCTGGWLKLNLNPHPETTGCGTRDDSLLSAKPHSPSHKCRHDQNHQCCPKYNLLRWSHLGYGAAMGRESQYLDRVVSKELPVQQTRRGVAEVSVA